MTICTSHAAIADAKSCNLSAHAAVDHCRSSQKLSLYVMVTRTQAHHLKWRNVPDSKTGPQPYDIIGVRRNSVSGVKCSQTVLRLAFDPVFACLTPRHSVICNTTMPVGALSQELRSLVELVHRQVSAPYRKRESPLARAQQNIVQSDVQDTHRKANNIRNALKPF